MPSSDYLRLSGLLLAASLALPAAAFEAERDAWMLNDAGAVQPLARQTDPETFRRMAMTGNDQEPVYAHAAQAELLAAVARRDRETVRKLLESGINANGLSGYRGDRALPLAVARGDVEIVRLLLDAGADPDLAGVSGLPLVRAALNGQLAIVRLLLKAGADIDQRAADSNTALTAATLMGHAPVVRELVRRRPDYALWNRDGMNALGIAAQLGEVECLRLMLEAGADANQRDRNNRPPLVLSDNSEHADEVEKLLVKYGGQSF